MCSSVYLGNRCCHQGHVLQHTVPHTGGHYGLRKGRRLHNLPPSSTLNKWDIPARITDLHNPSGHLVPVQLGNLRHTGGQQG